MFQRIKILALMQMSDKYKFKKIDNIKKFIAQILLRVLAVILITALCAVLVYLLTEVMFIPKNVNLLIFIIFLSQLLSVISCTSGLMKSLYLSNDNVILLSFPAKHVEIYLSKLLVFYIYEFIKNIFFLLPLFLGFGIIVGVVNVVYIISTIVMLFILPLFPVLIGALLSIPIVYSRRLLRRYSFIKIILSIAIAILLFFGVDWLVGQIPNPLRIVALYTTFINKVKEFVEVVNSYALYCNNIGNILYGINMFVNYLIIIGLVIGLFGLAALISMPLYFKMASHSREQSSNKHHNGKDKAHTNTFWTFVRKEWLLSIRSLGDFINNYVFIFAIPYVLYFMTSVFTRIETNQLGDKMIVAFVALISLLLVSASNTASSVAITTEGSEFIILKTAPGKTSNMAWAKILFNVAFSSIMILISFIILEIKTSIDSANLWVVFLCVLLINIGLIFWSFQLDILNPRLSEYASNHNIDNLKNISTSILIGFIVSVLFCALTIIFLMDDDILWWSWFRVIGMAVIFFVARFYLFKNFLKAYFADIEL